MTSELISRMRNRAEQLRRVTALGHDPRVIEAVQRVINEIEADIRRLEAAKAVTGINGVDG